MDPVGVIEGGAARGAVRSAAGGGAGGVVSRVGRG